MRPVLSALAVMGMFVGVGAASAAELSAADIVRALAGDPAASPTATRSFVPRTRSIDVNEQAGPAGGARVGSRPSAAAATATAPSGAVPEAPAERRRIDLAITFRSGSSEIDAEGLRQLTGLAAALKAPQLAGLPIEIVGHTDALGQPDSNLRLSMRRADEVRNRLWTDFGIDPSRIATRGEGQRNPVDPSNPTSEANRRVEIRNLGR
ncbi:OmpA family protein [Pinisolibacter aquiterrae]|uniref:OmpA family protein n=1 Tax=Pinisolibacter aquiterrae TaxID=2815579 RepID=UPI001C3E6188|nr:OmpA family protein [Pinisolibacter aquiterrae]MCC8235985.1 OmpA family protein [Pinisolibacter aquiterrae]